MFLHIFRKPSMSLVSRAADLPAVHIQTERDSPTIAEMEAMQRAYPDYVYCNSEDMTA